VENSVEYREAGSIDLEILFEYDSDRINPASVRQLIELGEALNDPELDKGNFMIAGHTDAAGSNAYNSDLSLRRAQAVSRFLTEFAGVDVGRLTMEGFGEEYLKYPDAPESGQNRRVEIINLGESG
jgi:outer membrane protein OmpA-like peptidoglycan-associated protein